MVSSCIRENPTRVLTGNAGRDDNNVSTGECLLQTVVLGQVASDDLQ